MEDLIGSTEAAAMLGCSRSTVKRMANAGTLPPAMRAPGTRNGTFLFRRTDVAERATRMPAEVPA